MPVFTWIGIVPRTKRLTWGGLGRKPLSQPESDLAGAVARGPEESATEGARLDRLIRVEEQGGCRLHRMLFPPSMPTQQKNAERRRPPTYGAGYTFRC